MDVSKLNFNSVVSNKVKSENLKNIPNFTSVPNSKSDEFIKKDGSNDNKFTAKEALKNLGKGVLAPVKAVIQHPFISLGMIAGTVAACALVPALTPIMTLGFGALSLFEIGKGTYNALKEYKHGNYDASEKSFEKIGSGLVGTLLTALGLKSSARTSLELAEAEKAGRPLTLLEKANLFQKVRGNNIIDSLKDNFKIFSKAGLSSTIKSLKPSSIGNRAKALATSFTSKTKTSVTAEELERRSNMTAKDIADEAHEILNKSFDEMGLPPEARPEIVVSDDLRYQTIEDANQIISNIVDEKIHVKPGNRVSNASYKVEVFKPGDNLSKMSAKEVIGRIKSVLSQDEKTRLIASDNLLLNRMLNLQNGKSGGNYLAASNRITIKTGAFREGSFSLEEIVAHEAMHAKMALYRNSLTTEETQQVLKELLRDRIVNGEPERIIQDFGIMGPNLMTPPKMSPRMRQDFLRYADEFIFKTPDNVDLAPLSGIIDANPDFVVQNGGTRQAALNILENYAKSHQNRFNGFSKVEIKGAPALKLNPEQYNEALQSVKDFVATAEGNSRNQGFNNLFGSYDSFIQYRFSPEELAAFNNGANFEKTKLLALLEDPALSAAKRAAYELRIQEIDVLLEFNRIGEKLATLQLQLQNNPNDFELAKQIVALKENITILDYYRLRSAKIPQDFYPINELPHLPHENK